MLTGISAGFNENLPALRILQFTQCGSDYVLDIVRLPLDFQYTRFQSR